MGKSSGKWKEYLAELLVVIIGITIAFSIENYAANRKEKVEELQHLKGIADDLKADLNSFEAYTTYNEETQVFVKRFNQLIQSRTQNDSLNWLLLRMGCPALLVTMLCEPLRKRHLLHNRPVSRRGDLMIRFFTCDNIHSAVLQ